MFIKLAATVLAATMAIAPAAAVVSITIENPGVTTTSANGTFAVETFDAAATGFQTSFTDTISGVTFAYTGIDVRPADQFGGVGGSNYAATYNGLNFAPYEASAGTYTLNLSTTGAPLNFFGAYFSAQDTTNQISFFNNNTLVASFSPAVVLGVIGNNSPYNTGGLTNFYANIFFNGGDTFNRVVFAAAGAATGFETDNHTVGVFVPPRTGIPISGPVPEPQTWALLVVGFGLVGFASRRKSAVAA